MNVQHQSTNDFQCSQRVAHLQVNKFYFFLIFKKRLTSLLDFPPCGVKPIRVNQTSQTCSKPFLRHFQAFGDVTTPSAFFFYLKKAAMLGFPRLG